MRLCREDKVTRKLEAKQILEMVLTLICEIKAIIKI